MAMLIPGTILQNRYRLEYPLNDNPNRQSWFAEDLENQEQVVVKLLALGGATHWDDLKLFEREAQILKHLDHPKIPKCWDYFSIDDQTLWFGLVQQYIPGISLKQSLNQGKNFTQEELYEVAEQILAILDYLHKFNPPILHRDIKPSNLILGQDQQIYLIDFGAVQAKPNPKDRTFTVVGTYGYTPLEQFGGQAVPASDLYALGATLIELLTGISPSDLPQKDLKKQFRDRLSRNPDPNFINWVDRLIEPSLDRRFRDVKEALDALHNQTANISYESVVETGIKLEKTAEYLNIFIPSHFDIEIIRPLKKWLNKQIEACQNLLPNLQQKWQKLTKAKRKQHINEVLIVVFGLIIGDILFAGLLGLFLRKLIGYLIILSLIILALMTVIFLIVWAVFLTIKRSEYYETIQIYLTTTYLEFNRYASDHTRKYRVDLNQIKDVSLTRFTDYKGTNYPSIVITIEGDIGEFALSNKDKTIIFGHQLTEAELNWLLQEIKGWVKQEAW